MSSSLTPGQIEELRLAAFNMVSHNPALLSDLASTMVSRLVSDARKNGVSDHRIDMLVKGELSADQIDAVESVFYSQLLLCGSALLLVHPDRSELEHGLLLVLGDDVLAEARVTVWPYRVPPSLLPLAKMNRTIVHVNVPWLTSDLPSLRKIVRPRPPPSLSERVRGFFDTLLGRFFRRS